MRHRRFVPGASGHALEPRSPLSAAWLAGPDNGPILEVAPEDIFVYPIEWDDPGSPIPSPIDVLPPPAEQINDPVVPAPPASVAPVDPFDDPWADPPVDHTPDGPNPPHSACPAFPPDE